MMNIFNIRAPDAKAETQIWLHDVCIGVRCENVATFNIRGGHVVVSGFVMVGEVYEQLPGPNTNQDGYYDYTVGAKLFIRRVINQDTVETWNLTTNMPGRCSVQFLLNTHNCRRIS